MGAAADGNFDRETTGPNNPANYVLLSHGNGWESLYYHMSANTITVKVGDTVKAMGSVFGPGAGAEEPSGVLGVERGERLSWEPGRAVSAPLSAGGGKRCPAYNR